MNIEFLPKENVNYGRRRIGTVVAGNSVKKLFVECIGRVVPTFSLYMTRSDIEYGLFTAGPAREHLPDPGVGKDNAIDLILVDITDIDRIEMFRTAVYYPKIESKDIQIRGELKGFFSKYVRDSFGNDLSGRPLADEQWRKCVEGDRVDFFRCGSDNTKWYIRYVKKSRVVSTTDKSLYAEDVDILETDKKFAHNIGTKNKEFDEKAVIDRVDEKIEKLKDIEQRIKDIERNLYAEVGHVIEEKGYRITIPIITTEDRAKDICRKLKKIGIDAEVQEVVMKRVKRLK